MKTNDKGPPERFRRNAQRWNEATGRGNVTAQQVYVPMAPHLAALKRDLELNGALMRRAARLIARVASGRHQASELSAAGHQNKWMCQVGRAPRHEPAARNRVQREPHARHLKDSRTPFRFHSASKPCKSQCGGVEAGYPINLSHSSHVATAPLPCIQSVFDRLANSVLSCPGTVTACKSSDFLRTPEK
jgi:hypothetical protein